MKLRSVLLYLFLLSILSCKNGNDPDPDIVVDFFDLTLSTINFTAEKDASLLVVKTNSDWTAECAADWIELSAYEGSKSTGFIIGASANRYFSREAIVIISAEGKTKEIKVKQAGVNSVSITINGVSFTLLPVKADTSFFLDGDTYLATRKVFLDSYFISETEITNAQWMAVTESLPYDNENSLPDHPVVVNWKNISENFLPKINLLSDYKFRLPTENEWEVAARGGLQSGNTSYAGGIYIDEVAWHYGNAEGKKHKVALKKPNELGLFDMSGNVSEWCSDWYAEWTETNLPPAESSNPTGPATGTEKIIRGGDFFADKFEYDKNSCRITSRGHLPPDINTAGFNFEGYNHYTGFRLVIANK
jgi:formylglycine-generating enzyme required for sulfatase activity